MKKHTQKQYPEAGDTSGAAFDEPHAAYYGTQHPGIIFKTPLQRPESQMTGFQKIDLIRKGISKNDFERFKDKAGLDYDQLANALSVARATLINKKGNEKFNQALSERIVSLADIYSYGYEVFEDVERFNDWVFRPNQALGGQRPFDFLDNQFGREEVKNLIGRIDYGVYS
ncbi:antitoxin Xre/MbcA/ParS toxin-binding domain-containing protein [Dyadobacter sp. 676]|uniref:Antitoxin Xre/MbcA/ParS toxin-binding domain-containing protein n=1 Tax=Dyadobacter sp. 676 TaxID=3088362 RepID=A0AAU8FDI2_9BACT